MPPLHSSSAEPAGATESLRPGGHGGRAICGGAAAADRTGQEPPDRVADFVRHDVVRDQCSYGALFAAHDAGPPGPAVYFPLAVRGLAGGSPTPVLSGRHKASESGTMTL